MRVFRVVAIVLTIVLSFLGGFFFAAFPDFTAKLIPRNPIRLGLCPEISLPASVRRALFEVSGKTVIPVNLNSREEWLSEATDLDIIPRTWINPKDLELRSDSFLRDDIAADFAFEDPINARALPLFWNVSENKPIQLLYLVVKNPFRLSQALTRTLTSSVIQNLWIKESHWKSTLKVSENLSIANEAKASFLRTRGLGQTNVELFFGEPVPVTTTTTTLPPPPALRKKALSK